MVPQLDASPHFTFILGQSSRLAHLCAVPIDATELLRRNDQQAPEKVLRKLGRYVDRQVGRE